MFLEAGQEVPMESVNITNLVVIVNFRLGAEHNGKMRHRYPYILNVLVAACKQCFLRRVGEVASARICGWAFLDLDFHLSPS
jgi:hypothetical protein